MSFCKTNVDFLCLILAIGLFSIREKAELTANVGGKKREDVGV